jgi:acyl CoA:acetate/3-ketoacid CoA transferase
MANRSDPKLKIYYFIDIELTSRRIIGWGTDTGDKVEIEIGNGCHRVFTSKGQYNKLVRQLDELNS